MYYSRSYYCQVEHVYNLLEIVSRKTIDTSWRSRSNRNRFDLNIQMPEIAGGEYGYDTWS